MRMLLLFMRNTSLKCLERSFSTGEMWVSLQIKDTEEASQAKTTSDSSVRFEMTPAATRQLCLNLIKQHLFVGTDDSSTDKSDLFVVN